MIKLYDINDSFRYEILINGEVLYCKDELKFELYRLDMYREYLDLNESRNIIYKYYIHNHRQMLNVKK